MTDDMGKLARALFIQASSSDAGDWERAAVAWDYLRMKADKGNLHSITITRLWEGRANELGMIEDLRPPRPWTGANAEPVPSSAENPLPVVDTAAGTVPVYDSTEAPDGGRLG